MPTPLLLISGFLGAGKTTFLSKLLPCLGQAGLRPHLVINDYGQAEIDAAALAQLAATVRAINGSCVCCESQDAFLDLLAAETLSPSSVMLIETNGTTDPYEIIEALGLDARAARYASPLHVCVIDAQRWQKRWWHNELERLQVRSASHFYLSKSDLAGEARGAEVKTALRAINPRVQAASLERLAKALATLPDQSSIKMNAEGADHAHHHHHEHSPDHDVAHAFVSLQLALPSTISRGEMAAWLEGLPREVVRAKGFVRLTEDAAQLYSFQKVEEAQSIIFLPLALEFAREPLALLIGVGLDGLALKPPV
jgi:G3E family GTPase